MLKRFLAWLFVWLTSPNPNRRHSGLDVTPLDLKQVAAELDLEAQAARLGQAGIPNPDATELCGVEAAILQIAEIKRHQYLEWAERRIGILNENIKRYDISKAVQTALQIDQAFGDAADDLYAREKSSLEALKDSAARALAELQAFRAMHRLTRTASYPSFGWSFFMAALIPVLIGIEAFINGSFFAEGNSGGILGGMMLAAVYAAANVLSAYSIGRAGIRYCWHRSLGWRIIGFTSTLGAAVLALLIALLITHMRNAFASGAADAQALAMQTLQDHPFVLGGTNSLMLFCASLGFALIAAIDGVNADDHYPGYGKVTRRARQARENFDMDVQDMREELVELRQQHMDELDKLVKQCQEAVTDISREIDTKVATQARLEQGLAGVAVAAAALLRQFRDTNEQHRNGLPLPSYFGQPYVAKQSSLPLFGIAEDRASLRRQEQQLTSLLGQEQEIRARIQRAFAARIEPVESFAQALPLDARVAA